MQEAEFQIETTLANVKSERSCKQCGMNAGKGKQICNDCRNANKKARERKLLKGIDRLPAVMNFKRDDDGNPIEKRCTICSQWLSIGSFNKRADTASGVRPFCKPCEKLRTNTIRASKPKPPLIIRTLKCEVCENDFQARGKSKYCSKECADKRIRDYIRGKLNSIHVATTTQCRRCGEIKPMSEFHWHRQPSYFKIRPSACASCKEYSFKKHRKTSNQKRNRSPKHKVRKALSKRFHEMMSTARSGGSHRLSDLIGCSTSFLRQHLESQFKKGIRWDNYGTKWHVDHIMPVSSFDHGDTEQVRKCWHFSNLRPLCAIENARKSNSIITHQPELLLSL